MVLQLMTEGRRAAGALTRKSRREPVSLQLTFEFTQSLESENSLRKEGCESVHKSTSC